MAIVAPMAEYRQLAGKSTSPLTHDIICLHTMVGTIEGSISWSARAGGSYWHFGLGGNGRLVQCQDLRYRSAANLYGNWHVIPIETADTKEGIFPGWSGSDVPGWTHAQIEKLVELVAWLCQRFDIPPVLVPDTRSGRRGIAYHRQGCDPWRVSGGELWSKAYGKVCPGDRRIDQLVNVVIPRVQAAVHGGVVPAPIPKEWDEMASKAEIQDVVRAEVGRAMQKLMANRNNTAYNPSNAQGAWLADAETLPGIKAELLEHVDSQVLRAVQAIQGRNNTLFDPAKWPWLDENPRLNDLDAKLDAILAKLPDGE